MTPLTRYEEETIVKYNAGEQTVIVYTRDEEQRERARQMVIKRNETINA